MGLTRRFSNLDSILLYFGSNLCLGGDRLATNHMHDDTIV
jgi:hypothetical protein